MYNFDETIDRQGTGCLKYDALAQIFGRTDLIPLWVADMDFRAPDFITDAIERRLKHPVFGYTLMPDDYFITVSSWIKRIHGWDVEPSSICFIPGIVKGIACVQRCFLKPGEKIVIQPPVYHPFRITAEKCGFTPVYNPLIQVNDSEGRLCGYRMDLEGLDSILGRDPSVRIILISNPHNPCGVAWDRETLSRLAEIATRHGVIVISDEIHSEMVLGGGTHIPFASVSDKAAHCAITFQAPSKTFNIAGIVSSYCIIQDEELRKKFFDWVESCEIDSANIFSIEATMAAYRYGDRWRSEMLEYVQGNVDYVSGRINGKIPGIHAVRPQASFLVWLDCRGLGLAHDNLLKLMEEGAHLAMNDGAMFGPGGEGFFRLNVGCPRSVLATAMDSLENAIHEMRQ